MEDENIKLLYLNHLGNKGEIMEELRLHFDFYNNHVIKKYRRNFSELELDGSFLIVLDRLFHKKELPMRNKTEQYTLIEYFNKLMVTFLKQELDISRGIKHGIRSSLAAPHNHIKKSELPYLKLFSDITNMNVDEFSWQKQELKVLREEITTFLLDNYTNDIMQYCVRHYIFGESYRDIATNSPHKVAYVQRLAKKAWESLVDHMDK